MFEELKPEDLDIFRMKLKLFNRLCDKARVVISKLLRWFDCFGESIVADIFFDFYKKRLDQLDEIQERNIELLKFIDAYESDVMHTEECKDNHDANIFESERQYKNSIEPEDFNIFRMRIKLFNRLCDRERVVITDLLRCFDCLGKESGADAFFDFYKKRLDQLDEIQERNIELLKFIDAYESDVMHTEECKDNHDANIFESERQYKNRSCGKTEFIEPPVPPVNAAHGPSLTSCLSRIWEKGINKIKISLIDKNKTKVEKPVVSVQKTCFSALAPQNFIKGEYSMIYIYMYEEQFRHVVDEAIKNTDSKMKETKSGILQVDKESKITVVLSSPDLEVMDNKEEQIWHGEYLKFSFAIELPEDFYKKQVLFVAIVYINDLIATKLKFVAKCSAEKEQKMEITREDILSAFMSYASQDRDRVAMIIQGMKKVRPDIDIFFDVDSLRCGEDWEKALWREID